MGKANAAKSEFLYEMMIVDQLGLDAEQLIIAIFQEDLEEEDEVEEDAEVNLEKVEEEMAAEYSEEEEDEILHIDEYSGITLHPRFVFRMVVKIFPVNQ